jgi:hypothetical protein
VEVARTILSRADGYQYEEPLCVVESSEDAISRFSGSSSFRRSREAKENPRPNSLAIFDDLFGDLPQFPWDLWTEDRGTRPGEKETDMESFFALGEGH